MPSCQPSAKATFSPARPAVGELAVGERLAEGGDLALGLLLGAGGLGYELHVVGHLVDLAARVGRLHHHDGGDLGELLDGGVGEVGGGHDQVRLESGDGVDAGLAPGADVLDAVGQGRGGVVRLIALHVGDADRLDAEGQEGLDDVPLGADDALRGTVQLHLLAAGVGDGEGGVGGVLLLRRLGGAAADEGGGGHGGEQRPRQVLGSHEVSGPFEAEVVPAHRAGAGTRVEGSVSTSIRMPYVPVSRSAS